MASSVPSRSPTASQPTLHRFSCSLKSKSKKPQLTVREEVVFERLWFVSKAAMRLTGFKECGEDHKHALKADKKI